MAENAMTPSFATERPRWVRQLDGFTQSSSFRQLMALVALAAVVSFMVGFFLWGQKPTMVPLYGNLSASESASIVDALKSSKQDYQLNSDGTIMVPPAKVPEIRMMLASQGLPAGNSVGLEMLNKDQSLGTSQFVEQARYHHAIEVEMARSIETMHAVRAARVHLAIPKQSVFVRDQKPATASVVVELPPGQSLSNEQVQAIVHLVASSVTGLTPDNISVVDQRGDLLTQDNDAAGMGLTDRQFAYRQRVERAYARRIESLLAPIVGSDKVRAQVSAKIDFSQQEGTSENYGPKQGVLLSEQDSENVQSLGAQGANAGGVPGSLSNQPPGGGSVSPPGKNGGGLQPPGNLNVSQYQQLIKTPINSQKNQTRNYNVDKNVRHTKYASGVVKGLNVAVLLDEKTVADSNGKPKAVPMSDAEKTRIRDLVSQAVGLDNKRGDKLTLASIPFVAEKVEPTTVPIWSQDWFWPTVKNVGLGAAMLLVFLLVVRPLLRILSESRQQPEAAALPPGGQSQNGQPQSPGQAGLEHSEEGVQASIGGQRPANEVDENVPQLVGDAAYTEKLKQLRQSVNHDPKAVAAVIKQWTNSES